MNTFVFLLRKHHMKSLPSDSTNQSRPTADSHKEPTYVGVKLAAQSDYVLFADWLRSSLDANQCSSLLDVHSVTLRFYNDCYGC